jgi:pimeloyl-ACP methyl ester carboxylesterase
METRQITLPDGRILAYAEYGDPAGHPLIWCHGNPGCRREADMLEPTLLARKRVRMIVPDRPGIGLSTWRAARRLIDWPGDLAALAAALKLEHFGLVGVSAGAAYALVSARALAHKLTCVGVISGIAAQSMVDAETRRSQNNRYFELAHRSYWLARGVAWRMRRQLHQPEKLLTQALAGFPPPDQAALADPRTRQVFLTLLHEALRQGTRGMAWDARLVAGAWGFDLADIRIPVYLWHGSEDRNAPPAMGGYLASEIPDSHFELLPGEGHFSLVLRHMGRILDVLLD